MKIILDEIGYAQDVLGEQIIPKRAVDAIYILAKYYSYMGAPAANSIKKIRSYLERNYREYNVELEGEQIRRSVRWALKHPATTVDGVNITKGEIDKIRDIPSKLKQRLMFTMLCLAKYYTAVNPNVRYWVKTPYPEILAMSNSSMKMRDFLLFLHALREMGYVGFAKAGDNLSLHILIAEDGVDADTDKTLWVQDFENLGYEWMRFLGGDIAACSECGKLMRRRGNRHKYCKECAKEINIQKTLERRLFKN